MKKIRIFLPFFVVAVCLFLQWSPSNALIFPTKTSLKVAGSQPFVAFQPVTLVASVTAAIPIPAGGIVIYSTPTSGPLWGGPVDSNGRISITMTFVPGLQAVHANYVGVSNLAASTSPFMPVQVVKAFAGTSIRSTNPNITYGSPMTFSVVVTPIAPSVPDPNFPPNGTISFYDGSTVIATESLINGTLTFSGYLFSVGTHNVVAVYSGDSNFLGSESPQTIVVKVSAP